MPRPIRPTSSLAVLVAFVVTALVAGCATPYRYSGAITASENPNVREMPTTKVALKDRVVVVTHVDWVEAEHKGGSHAVRWNWYEGDTLIAERTRTMDFGKPPFRFFRSIGAADLGLGHYRVEVLVDGVRVDEQLFDVVAN